MRPNYFHVHQKNKLKKNLNKSLYHNKNTHHIDFYYPGDYSEHGEEIRQVVEMCIRNM